MKSAGRNNSDNEDLENDDDIYENDGNGKSQNQFLLIFPSKRNPLEQYQEFMDYSQKCYENFTGSYSKKNREEKEAAKIQAENNARE